MKNRGQVAAVIAIAGILIAAAYPYMLVRVDEYVRLGVVGMNGMHIYANQCRETIVNIFFEPVKSVENFKIGGTISLTSPESTSGQSLSDSEFRNTNYKTNLFSLSPLIVGSPRDQRVVVSLDITNTVEVPFNVILRCRTYRFPTTW